MLEGLTSGLVGLRSGMRRRGPKSLISALVFDGSADQGVLLGPPGNELIINPALSYDITLGFVAASSSSADLLIDGRDGGGDGFALQTNAAGKLVHRHNGTSITSTTVVNDDLHHTARMIWDGARIYLEIDGAPEVDLAATTTLETVTTQARLGVAFNNASSARFVGLMDFLTMDLDQ